MLDKLIDYAIHTLLWGAVIFMGIAIATAFTGCMTDPSQWRPGDHMMMARNCRVVCRPGEVKRYDSMDGSCECQPSTPSRSR